jgi:hypothetical protein
MQTRTLGDLILLIESLLGGTFNNVSEMRIVLRLINRRLTTAYNRTQSWPRYLGSSEERRLYALDVSGITGSFNHVDDPYFIYGQDANGYNVYREEDTHNEQGSASYDIFYYNDTTDKWILAYVAEGNLTKDATTGVVTVTSPTTISTGDTVDAATPADVETWTNEGGVNGTLLVKAVNLITYAQTGKTTIGEFIRIHRKKAFLNSSQLEYDFFLDITGANVLTIANLQDSKAFVTYKKLLTLISHTESGANDDAVRDGYRSSTAEVPNEFFSYLAHSSFADLLRAESQFEDALREEAVAENYLSAELEKLDIIANNNNLKKKFSTHLNRNSR